MEPGRSHSLPQRVETFQCFGPRSNGAGYDGPLALAMGVNGPCGDSHKWLWSGCPWLKLSQVKFLRPLKHLAFNVVEVSTTYNTKN